MSDSHTLKPTQALAMWATWVRLIPEAPLLVVLLGIYQGFHQPTWLAPMVALLVIWFLVRSGALFLARLTIDQQRYADAEALLRVAGWMNPWSADHWGLKGMLALALHQPEAAESALRRALEYMPHWSPYQLALSTALLDLQRPQEALAITQQVLLHEPNSALAYLALAEAERVAGYPDEQIEQHVRHGLNLAQEPGVVAALQCALAAQLLQVERHAEAHLALRAAETLLEQVTPSRRLHLDRYLTNLRNQPSPLS